MGPSGGRGVITIGLHTDVPKKLHVTDGWRGLTPLFAVRARRYRCTSACCLLGRDVLGRLQVGRLGSLSVAARAERQEPNYEYKLCMQSCDEVDVPVCRDR